MIEHSTEYTENELRLIRHYNYMDLIPYVHPPTLYTQMAIRAFLWNDQSQYARALRGGLAILESGGYRKTPEFEAVINIDNWSSQ